ncbi:MAG: DNA-directed RNA polymerase subunit omega [Streptococcaceae bacterium]|jgi:DNA-directed RNA polymerase subunit omega|nr:DNA-directed RNA polymerase subunit omega [Streptococcaceae bacterium]
MMLKPSIDKLLDQVNSKYSLVILSSKRAHELGEGQMPTKKNFDSVKPVLQSLEEIETGHVIVHPNPESKRERIRREKELARLAEQQEQEKLKQQIEKENTGKI